MSVSFVRVKRSSPTGTIMYRKLLIGAALLLSACGPKVTQEACVKSDAQTYISIDRSETGTTGPNRAGQEAFNKRILVDGFNNRRESQFGFVMKSEVPGNPSSDMTCKNKKITCEDPAATWCSTFKCKGDVPAGAHINIIDTPRSEFYKTTQKTYMEWDGQTLKCKVG